VLNRTFGCVRVVWNRTLAWRHARYHGEQIKTNFTQASACLTGMKATEELAAGLAVGAGTGADACGADVRHSGSSRVQSAVKQEPQPAKAGIPVLRGAE